MACCSLLLTATRRMSPCWAASQIPRASAASSLLPLMKGRTWCVGNKLDLMAQRTKGAPPVVGTAARFHGDPAGRTHGEEFCHFAAWELLAADLSCVAINPVNLENVLGDIHAVRCSIHLGNLSSQVVVRNSTLALDAVRREVPPFSTAGGAFPLAEPLSPSTPAVGHFVGGGGREASISSFLSYNKKEGRPPGRDPANVTWKNGKPQTLGRASSGGLTPPAPGMPTTPPPP
jgi:hypothetical protein